MKKVRQINRGCIREKGVTVSVDNVLGRAASEGFCGGVKHDHVYELFFLSTVLSQ